MKNIGVDVRRSLGEQAEGRGQRILRRFRQQVCQPNAADGSRLGYRNLMRALCKMA